MTSTPPTTLSLTHGRQVDGQTQSLPRNQAWNGVECRLLPPAFIEWQLQARRAMLAHLQEAAGPPNRFAAHLPVMVTYSADGPFPFHTANKGAGFTPLDEWLDHYTQSFEAVLAWAASRPVEESRLERLRAVREFYAHPERIDFCRLGFLEIFRGSTYRNLQADPRVSLHFTGDGPDYPSFQVNGLAEIIDPGDKRFRFLFLVRRLFEMERFHILQPDYPLGYLVWVVETYDKSPHHGRAGRKIEPVAFQQLFVPTDNSRFSAWAGQIALQIAGKFGATITGTHVYAARLHDRRFRDMEPGLPEHYQSPEILENQRAVHDTLITRGLRLISDSYLDALERQAAEAGISFRRSTLEGKNYAVLVKEIETHPYDLVILGARGLGEAKRSGQVLSPLGSVCERVARRIRRDLLVVKNDQPLGGLFVVGIDGSARSFTALRLALALAGACGACVQAVAAYDPFFHKVTFNSLKDVLSDDARRVFNSDRQEQLHDELIDDGIAKIYRDHLETAQRIAAEVRAEIETHLLAGKAFVAVLRHVTEVQPTLLALGRTGVHADEDLDIGSNAENLLRLAPCHVLLASRTFNPTRAETREVIEDHLPWTETALARLARVPDFARSMARRAIEDYARQRGASVVDDVIVTEAKDKFGM